MPHYGSPPPTGWRCGPHGEPGIALLRVLKDMYQDMAPLRRIVVGQLIVVTVVVECIGAGRDDPLCAAALGVICLGLMANFASVITLYLRRQSTSNRVLAFFMDKLPVVTGPVTELALAVPLRHDQSSATHRFLAGTVYAKLLAIGALCLLCRGQQTGVLKDGGRTMELHNICGFLATSGAFVLALPPRIESDSRWISQGVPLFLVVNAGLSYYLTAWRAGSREGKARDGRVANPTSRERTGNEWIVFLIILGVLKMGVVRTGHQLQERARAIDSLPESNRVLIESVALPLAIAAANHSADIASAWHGHEVSAWINLIQSAMQTCFFVRPLAVFAGHDVDLTENSGGLGLCFLMLAAWLWVPGVPHRVKGAALLITYCYLMSAHLGSL